MTDPESPAGAWVCPGCERRVPHRVAICRCGCARPDDVPAPPPAAPIVTGDAGDERANTSIVRTLIVGAALIAAVYFAAMRSLDSSRPDSRPQPSTASAGARPASPIGRPAETAAPEPGKRVPLPEIIPPEESTRDDSSKPAGEPPPLEEVVGRAVPAVVTIIAGDARGSGFFVAPDTLLTNVHVVGSNSSVMLRLSNGRMATARVERTSNDFDIAVLKVSNPSPNQPVIRLGSALSARAGQEVLAIGTPLGFLQNTVSRGIVSGLRDVDGSTVVQTDAAVNPGNSGGPLLDRRGAAIGIIKSGYTGRNGLSFAVAIEHARAVLDGRTSAPTPVSATRSEYQALTPAVASPTDQARTDAAKTYEQAIAKLARTADALDNRWRSFKGVCYQGAITGRFEREWYAFFEPNTMTGAVPPGCNASFEDIRSNAEQVRDGILAADEAARHADVYPGTRRDILRRFRLDYAGWTR